MELNQGLMNISDTLRKMDHGTKADYIDTFHMEVTEKINRLEKENLYLKSFFKSLDSIYQPHEKSIFGLLDSPQSLIGKTREVIDIALKMEF